MKLWALGAFVWTVAYIGLASLVPFNNDSITLQWAIIAAAAVIAFVVMFVAYLLIFDRGKHLTRPQGYSHPSFGPRPITYSKADRYHLSNLSAPNANVDTILRW